MVSSAVIDAISDGVVVLQSGCAVYANPAWCRLLGHEDPAALTGRSLEAHVVVEDRPLLADLLDGRLGERGPTSVRFLDAQGEPAALDIIEVIRVGFKGAPAVGLICRDGELRRHEARAILEDRILSISTLAAGVAHEINNPLSYVLGNLDFLAEEVGALAGALEPAAHEELTVAIQEARDGARRVRQIVRDLQAFARADQAAAEGIDLRRTIDLAINMAWIEIRHRARLVKDFEVLPPVEGSEARLGQAFLCLLLNAARALPEGEADKHQIRVSARAESDRVIVDFKDSGPGLEPHTLRRVFEPFATRGSAGIGTSLGLSIAHSIVTELGGEIEVSSQPGDGTLFRVQLRTRAGRDAAAARGASRSPASAGARRVLVVDDEVLVGSALRRALREHDVTTVESGRQAIEALSGPVAFDLIFCDLMMPELTGMDVYDWLKANRPGTEQRMIFMSGGTFTRRAEEFLSAVPNHRIEKPFDLERVRSLAQDLTPPP